ncbi:MAG: hypothetical protein DRI97_03895 [Bacteroidetes bacterium]|nr:MAG: hypothetical protein DRQ42_00410 [Gammaproteobacteria bacterium]RLD58097.1 MAG: hypothetical protein DRI97_03895 [Bacteroidota bacterium]
MIPKSTINEGASGKCEVIKFTVSKKDSDFFNMRQMFNGHNRTVNPGEYTKLIDKENMCLWMSDTPAELRDHYDMYHEAKGNVLINGLGLGVVVVACLLKEEVDLVVVNEINPDIIKLVAPQLFKQFSPKKSLIINEISAFDYHPKKLRFDTIWHDIWANIDIINHPEYVKLMRRYGHWKKSGGFHNCWAYYEIKRMKREENKGWWG